MSVFSSYMDFVTHVCSFILSFPSQSVNVLLRRPVYRYKITLEELIMTRTRWDEPVMLRRCNQYFPPAHHHSDEKPCFEGFTRTVLALQYNPSKTYATFAYVYLRKFPSTHKFCFGDVFRENTAIYMRSNLRVGRKSPFTTFFQPGPYLVRRTAFRDE